MATATATARLFFALWPDAKGRTALARLGREVAHHAQGRAPRADGVHLTLVFLGPVSPERIPSVLAAGAAAASTAAPFDVSLARIGGNGFGIAWFTPDGLPPALSLLHEALLSELERAGFPRERRMFRPHVTLARDCLRPAHRGALPPITWPAERLALVASSPAAGPRYRDVATWPLGLA